MESAGEINWPFVTQRLMLMQRVLQFFVKLSQNLKSIAIENIDTFPTISNFSFTLELVQVILTYSGNSSPCRY